MKACSSRCRSDESLPRTFLDRSFLRERAEELQLHPQPQHLNNSINNCEVHRT